MRVLQVTGSYPIPPLGGMELTVYALGREYARMGCETVAVAPTLVEKHDRVDGTEFIGLPSRTLSNWIKIPSWSSYRKLDQWVRWAEVVQVHNPPEFFCYLASRLAWKAQKPVITAVVSPGELRHHPRLAFRALGSIDELLVTMQLRRAGIVQVKNSIDSMYVDAITPNHRILPDGISPEFFSRPRNPTIFLSSMGLGVRHPVLLYLGRVHEMKGPTDFVRAAALLLPEFPSLVAFLAGPGSPGERSRIRSLIQELHVEEQVRYLGPLSEEDKIRAIDGADVLVVPTLADFAEGFSMVSSEAWARGKPVAAYAVGALKVRISEGVNGCLARPGDPEDLARATVRALNLSSFDPPSDVRPWSDVAHEILDWSQSLLRYRSRTKGARNQ